jgi:hypothetical protein
VDLDDHHVPMTDDDMIIVELPARLWSAIDATVDNSIALAGVEGEEEVVRTGQEIRRAGWDQVPWVDGAWPPMDQILTIRLSGSQWRFAMDKVAGDEASYVRIGDRESLELGREALAVVSPHLP